MDTKQVLKYLLIPIIGVVIYYFFFYEGMENSPDSLGYDTSVINHSLLKSLPIDPQSQNFVDNLDDIDLSEDLLTNGNNINLNTAPLGLKNPNLQLRSDPKIEEKDTGFFNNSTVVPTYQKPVLGI